MATITGPLHSDRADGSVNKQLTFKETKRGATVCRYSYPGSRNPFTPNAAQRAIRQRTGTIMKAWRTLSQAEQDTWIEPAHDRELEPINLFQIINFKRLTDGLDLLRSFTQANLPTVDSFAAASFAATSFHTLTTPS